MGEYSSVLEDGTRKSRSHLSRRRLLGAVFGTTISVVSLVLVFRGIEVGDVTAILRRTDGRLVALALLTVLLNYAGLAARWGILFYPHHKPSFAHLFGAQVVAQLVNTTLPGRLSPLVRVGWLRAHTDISTTFTLSTIIMEKTLDGVVFVAVLLAVLSSTALPSWIRDAGLATGVVSTVVVAAVASAVAAKPHLLDVLCWLAEGLPALTRVKMMPAVRSALDSLDVWRHPRQVLRLAVWSGVVWGSTALLNYFTLRALHLKAPFLASVVILLFVQAGLRIPSSPGSIGVFHYLCILALSLFDVSRDAALGYAIVLHLLNFLPQSMLGIAFVWQARNRFGLWFPAKLLSPADQPSREGAR